MPGIDPRVIYPPAKYELFAVIVCEGENFSNSTYFPLVKKRHKVSNKYQWYAFKQGLFNRIDKNEVLTDYFPQILFYRLNKNGEEDWIILFSF